MKNTLETRDNSAVSEAISYVLIFGLISLGVAIVTLQGGPAIESSEQQQIDHNSENAINLVQDRLEEMMRQNAPVREATISLQDITVGVGGELDPTVINVTNVTAGESYETTVDPVYVETGSRTILYEGGGVMIGQQGIDGSWSMTSDPAWAVRTDGSGYVQSIFLRVPSTTGNGQVSGEGNARWEFESIGETNEVMLGVDELNVTVTSPRSGAWEGYFERLNSSVTDEDITEFDDDRATLEIDDGFDGEGRVSYDEAVLRTEVETE